MYFTSKNRVSLKQATLSSRVSNFGGIPDCGSLNWPRGGLVVSGICLAQAAVTAKLGQETKFLAKMSLPDTSNVWCISEHPIVRPTVT
jgi:hypothetical protein